jgi:hypothetical protein
MELFRLHAYSVLPQRTAESRETPAGGAVKVSAELRAVMESSTQDARFADQSSVDFDVDPMTRTNEVRDAILNFGFGEAAAAKAAALSLAARLSEAMDLRSADCLFIPTAFHNGDMRRVILWIFPRDAAFQLRSGTEGPTIDILTNVFSQKSRLRKAALFEGLNIKTNFLSGRVLDHQANSFSRDAADFWIARFLLCGLSIKDESGTRMLAKALRLTLDELDDLGARQQLNAAVVAIRHAPKRRISLTKFADNYLGGNTRETFLAHAPNDQSRNALFGFDRATFDRVLHFRVFELDTGVIVSAPLSQIGETVQIDGTAQHLKCAGAIVGEKLRTKHA